MLGGMEKRKVREREEGKREGEREKKEREEEEKEGACDTHIPTLP